VRVRCSVCLSSSCFPSDSVWLHIVGAWILRIWARLLNIYSEVMESQKYSVTWGERALGPFAIKRLVRQHAKVRRLQTAPGTDSVLNSPCPLLRENLCVLHLSSFCKTYKKTNLKLCSIQNRRYVMSLLHWIYHLFVKNYPFSTEK